MKSTLLIMLSLFIFSSCREFRDEEFKDFERSRDDISPTPGEDQFYKAELKTTDERLNNLKGNASISFKKDQVKVTIDLKNIPANFIQLHYSFMKASCSSLSFALPSNTSSTRSFSLNESMTIDALSDDLKSSLGDGNTYLGDKSLVIKAFYNFSGIGQGTNEIKILCGEIQETKE